MTELGVCVPFKINNPEIIELSCLVCLISTTPECSIELITECWKFSLDDSFKLVLRTK